MELAELLDLAFLTYHGQHLGLGETGGIISLMLESSKHDYPTGSGRLTHRYLAELAELDFPIKAERERKL